MRRFASGLGLTLRYWMQTEVHVYAFSVAANVLLSFFPFLIVMLSLSRRVFGEQAAVGAIDLALRDYFPDALGQFLERNLPQTGSVQLVSILLLLFTANGIFEPLEVGLNRVWGVRKNRSFFRNQIVSLGLIFICGGLALSSMMMTALNQSSFRVNGLPKGWIQAMGGGSAAWVSVVFFKLAAVPLAVLVLFLIYRYLPNGPTPLHRVIPAAIFVGLLMEVLKYVNTLLWPGFQRKLAREYGVFQYSVTLIFLGFLASMLVLAGAEWAARGHRLDETLETVPHN
ncbi:MAG: YihY/virulence factor BrkB family protein [Acidobacteriota bacterium]|nr:YihY/virulence factor BrkB family protein [Acidobacteriota bacterium]